MVWGLPACGQHIVNFFHLVRVLVIAKQLQGYGSEGVCHLEGVFLEHWQTLIS